MRNATATLPPPLAEALRRRSDTNQQFFSGEAARIADVCQKMAERFQQGGRLLALGPTPADRSDARHVAVEFVHPVIVGKRALPALAICVDGGDIMAQMHAIARPVDIVIGFGAASADALRNARARGCLTVGHAAEWQFTVPSDDPAVRQELTETLYHLLWELVHVFLDHQRQHNAAPEQSRRTAFLYPFLQGGAQHTDGAAASVRESVLLKAAEITALRDQTVTENAAEISAAAAAIRGAATWGGTTLVMGNGGSATDAMDFVADLRSSGIAALDLTDDAAILTAIANDIGVDAIFLRQVIAYARTGDVAVALSTSGNSLNLIAALTEAKRRGCTTIALVGYDGGRIASEGLADHVIVTRSEQIPRIQEAQATAYHLLCQLARAT